jgi:hypothetical protein
MMVYHGSTISIEKPLVLATNRRLDFGPGFYTTTDLEPARRWALIKQRRALAAQARVSVYAFDASTPNLNAKHFEAPDESWLDFVMANRMGRPTGSSFDIISGPVANDTLYRTLSLFERGILTRQETIVRLRAHALANQIVFCTEASLTALTYEHCLEVVS